MATSVPRVVFARIGWMERYEGPSQSEPGPKRGGSYNEANVGYEVFNYQPLDGRYYGYFQSPGDGRVNLSRIDPSASGDSLSGVRVVWVATKDTGGQVVVGWYSDATLLAEPVEYPAGAGRSGFWYKCVAEPHNAVRLDVARREWTVPVGRSGIGQANVLYPIDENGQSRLGSPDYEWMKEVLDRIESHSSATSGEPVSESILATVGGQGYTADPAWRRELEMHAMTAALLRFREEGYDTADEHGSHPYDLRCTRGKETLFVEVKGTTSPGGSVVVTAGEVRFAREHSRDTALFVLHSVERNHGGQPIGGKAVVVRPWKPKDDDLDPLTYTYTRPT